MWQQKLWLVYKYIRTNVLQIGICLANFRFRENVGVSNSSLGDITETCGFGALESPSSRGDCRVTNSGVGFANKWSSWTIVGAHKSEPTLLGLLPCFCSAKSFQGLRQILLVGGNSVDDDIKRFKKSGGHIVICTPGRLEDLLSRKQHLNLPASVKFLVKWWWVFYAL